MSDKDAYMLKYHLARSTTIKDENLNKHKTAAIPKLEIKLQNIVCMIN